MDTRTRLIEYLGMGLILKVARSEVEAKLTKQIDQGINLLHGHRPQLKELRFWHDYNVELLERLFDGPQIVDDYKSASVAMAFNGGDATEVYSAHIVHLESLRARLDLATDSLGHTSRTGRLSARETASDQRAPRVRLFISHAHLDSDVASRLVDVLRENFQVPDGELRCTSVPGFQLDLGAMAPDALRHELSVAECVIGILTPNSVSNEWVLFELGSAWANTKLAIPLLAGGLVDRDIPGPLRGAAGGQLTTPLTLDRLLDQLQRILGWSVRPGLTGRSKCHDLVEYVKALKFGSSLHDELTASFTAKRTHIGQTQSRLLDLITSKARNGRAEVSIGELSRKLSIDETELYYRLENLRLLGFLAKVQTGDGDGVPQFSWNLSDTYRSAIDF